VGPPPVGDNGGKGGTQVEQRLGQRVVQVQDQVTRVEQRLERFEDKVDARFDKVDARFERTDAKIDGTANRVTALLVAILVAVVAKPFFPHP